jgi:glycine/D-amino acid oxidase-like deaminating enzyme
MTGTTSSLWASDDSHRSVPKLARDVRTDVCVVGAGIAGLTTAYLLASQGQSVLLLEANEGVALGETGYTTAHLAWVLDDRFTRVASIRGDDVTKAAADSHRAAVALIEQLSQREKIDCDFRWVYGHLVPGADGPDQVEKETETLKRLGLAFERLEQAPVASLPGPCLRFSGHARFHPAKYMAGLADAFRRRGGALHTQTRVQKIEGGDRCTVTTEGGGDRDGEVRRGRDQLAVRRGDALTHANGRVPDLRDGVRGAARRGPRRPVLGHRGPLPLRPPATG